MRNIITLSIMAMLMVGCSTTKNNTTPPTKSSPRVVAELSQGKRSFEKGAYKDAMKQLFPLAAAGNAEAEYAVGYMYYYGYGVKRNLTSGKFWIGRSAKQKYQPAIDALKIINEGG